MSSHVCRLSQVPDDILLHILSFSGLLDNVSFSMVCKKMHALSMRRSFWIYALETESFIRPIACPAQEDLTKHDFQSLRRIALHTLRLQRNWASETPQIIGPIRTFPLGLAIVEGFYQIPGTELYIFHILREHTLELWHIGLGARVGPPIQVPETLINMAGRVTIPGQFLIAFLGSNAIGDHLQYQIVVARLEYGCEDIALNLLFRHELTKGSQHCRVFLDDDIVGTLCSYYSSEGYLMLCVTTLNLVTMKEVLIMTDVPSSLLPYMDATMTPIVDGDLHILVAQWNIPEFLAFIIPRTQLPHTNNPRFSEISTEILHVEFYPFQMFSQDARILEPRSNLYAYMIRAHSNYGIPALSIVTASAHSMPYKFLDVHFWVRSGDPKVPIRLLGPRMVIPGALDPGSEDFYQPAVMAPSGKRAVFLYNVMEEDRTISNALGLVSYEPDIVSFRKLAIPKSINMSDMYTLAVDDHMGVVTLFDTHGSVYTISYA